MQENKIRDRLAHAYYQREKSCEDDEVAFIEGWDACASHTTAVSVEGEKAYEAWCEREGNLRTDFERDAFIAGFQARSPLVELLRETKQVLDTLLLNDLARDIYYRIDAALKGEK